MKEITTEQKAITRAQMLKTYATYWESDCLYTSISGYSETRHVSAIIQRLRDAEGADIANYYKLLLKPLSEISDEQYEILVRMIYRFANKVLSGDDAAAKTRLLNTVARSVRSASMPSDVFQKLIEWGYSVPLECLGGQDPIAAGLAIAQK